MWTSPHPGFGDRNRDVHTFILSCNDVIYLLDLDILVEVLDSADFPKPFNTVFSD